MNIKDLPLRPPLTPYKINRLKIKSCFKIAHFGHFLTFLGSDTNFRELAPKIRVQLIVPEIAHILHVFQWHFNGKTKTKTPKFRKVLGHIFHTFFRNPFSQKL